MKLDNILAKNSIRTLYRDGNLSIKVYNEETSKSDVIAEALNQARVEETGINVPKIISVEQIDGKWAIISEYIEGKTLEELIDETPSKRHKYIELMADLHIEVLTRPCKILNRLNDKMTANIMAADFDAITRFDLHRRILEMPVHSKICHGGFVPANISFTKDGRAYILAWSNAAQGNASADVVRSCLLLRLAGREDIAREYFEVYSEKSNTKKEYMLKWFPLVTAGLSAEMRGNDRERLIEWFKNRNFI